MAGKDHSSQSQSSNNPEPIQRSMEEDIETAIYLDDEFDDEFDDQFDDQEDHVDPDLEELADLDAELGMEEVDLDQAVIDTVAMDDLDTDQDAALDTDDDDYSDDTEEDDEIIDDRPQAFTESYGTGLQGKPSDRAGRFSRRGSHLLNQPDVAPTGGDVDANPEDANTVGEEAVGGTVATPDQDIVDELAAAVGVEMDDRSDLRVNDRLERRDDRRWELDPQSAEDYEDRRE